MRFNLFAISAAIAACVSAQGTIPSCAQNCVNTLLPASCNLDPRCICADTNFISNISCCIFNACPTSEQTNALNFAKQYCTPVGVTLPAAASCPSGSASSSGSASVTSSAASSSRSASSSAASSASSVASSASSAASAAATSRAAGEKLAAQGLGLVGAVVGAVVLL